MSLLLAGSRAVSGKVGDSSPESLQILETARIMQR